MCYGIESNPFFSKDLDKNGAGKQPTLGNPSVSENGNIDGNKILSGYSNGMLFPSEVE